MLTALVFLPLAGGLLAALLPAGRGGRAAGMVTLMFALATLGRRDRAARGLRLGRVGSSTSTNVNWIPELGIHYKLGLDGLNLFLILMTRAAVGGRHRRVAAARLGAPAPLLPDAGAGRDRGAGRVLRAGPGAVRPLLRPDAGAVLLPDRHLGRAEPRARDDHVRDLHAGREPADAGRGGSHRHPRDAGRRQHLVRAVDAARSGRCRRAARSGSSCCSRSPSS